MNVYKNITIEQLKALSSSQIDELAQEIRETIMDTVSKNGGHLASNLGVVEATIALHRVFDSPKDKFVFDVGHQCYAHKLLTGRAEGFDTLRKYGGTSGFSNPTESEHDPLYEGHCGTSLSAALGLAEANRIQGKDDYVVAIVGDGALTNGMIYEALNNCAGKNLNIIILINDNEMSISKNVGGLHRYLSKIRSSKGYFSFKRGLGGFLRKIPLIGKPLASFFKWIKNGIRKTFLSDTLFEDMGLVYLGPIDGHDVEKLSDVLEEAKTKHVPCVVHMKTKKGQGYSYAEEHPENYHSVGTFAISEGAAGAQKASFSSVAGDCACALAENDPTVCAITAAMCDGTGLTRFSQEYPERFFDVGIAEEHAVTFAGGLSKAQMKPILFLYSTFAQRGFDQFFHDISIQDLPLVLALDRSGIVSGDGITHQGIFDCSMLTTLPGVEIYSPESYEDLRFAFSQAIESKALSVVRYPKGQELVDYERDLTFIPAEDKSYSYTEGVENAEVALISYGRISYEAYRALRLLEGKYSVGMVKLKKIYPLDFAVLSSLTKGAKIVCVVEEGIRSGGIAEKIALALSKEGKKVQIRAIENYVRHGSLQELLQECGLTGEQIAEDVAKNFEE
jgi:1-deoxy-D-xylulose-5-phosphate synthase